MDSEDGQVELAAASATVAMATTQSDENGSRGAAPGAAFVAPFNQFVVPVNGFIAPALIVLTLVTNCAVCAVLLRPHMRSPTNILLVAIASSDMLTGQCSSRRRRPTSDRRPVGCITKTQRIN